MFALYVRRSEKPWRRSRWRKDRISFDIVATSEDRQELVMIARQQYGGKENLDWFIQDHSK